MTIDEAIKHAEEVADTKLQYAELSEIQGCYNNAKKCYAYAEEHRQLAEWLKELQAHREAWDGMKEGLLEMSRLHEYVSIKCMIRLIDGFRPKEGDAE